MIAALKTLGFLDASGRPTANYSLLKNSRTAKTALASGIRAAYAPLFSANENANALTGDELKGLISQVSGADEDRTSRIYSTFQNLAKLADFTISPEQPPEPPPSESEEERLQVHGGDKKQLRADFHYNIQIHLPSNGTEETYLNIFNAVRKAFL